MSTVLHKLQTLCLCNRTELKPQPVNFPRTRSSLLAREDVGVKVWSHDSHPRPRPAPPVPLVMKQSGGRAAASRQVGQRRLQHVSESVIWLLMKINQLVWITWIGNTGNSSVTAFCLHGQLHTCLQRDVTVDMWYKMLRYINAGWKTDLSPLLNVIKSLLKVQSDKQESGSLLLVAKHTRDRNFDGKKS